MASVVTVEQKKTMRSSSHRCAYFRCQNIQNKSHLKSMFRFPCNDKRRLKVWLDNCGNATIDHLPPERLRNHYICVDHFDPKYVKNGTGHRKRISKNAIPEPFNFQPPEFMHESRSHSPASPELWGDEDVQVIKMEDENEVAWSTPQEDVNEGAWSTPEKHVIKMEDVNEGAWSTPEKHVIKIEDVNEGAWSMLEENVINVIEGERSTPEEDVRNETRHRKRILKNAVPKPFDFPLEIKHELLAHSPASPKPIRVYVNKKLIDRNKEVQVAEMEFVNVNGRNTSEKDVNAAWSTPKEDVNAIARSMPERKKRLEKEENEDTEEVKKLKTLLVAARKQLKRAMNRNKLLKNKVANKNIVNLETHKFKSDTSKLITKMQLRKSKSKKHWSEEEKQFSMSLYSISPAAYMFMRNSGIVLPNRSTIQRWRQESNCQPGGLSSNSNTEITS